MVTLRIALRYLLSRKSHTAVNVISLISVAGVAVATMAIVCVLSVFNGFSDLAYSQISTIAPDLRVEPVKGKIIAGADSLTAIVRRLPGVIAAAPTLEERGLAAYGGDQMPVRLKGITEAFDTLTAISRLVKEDGWFATTADEGSPATLSVGVALRLEARPGSELPIELYMPRRVGRINPANPAAAFRADSVMIGGVYQAEQSDYDTDMILVGLGTMRRLLNYSNGEATAIEVAVAPGADVGATARHIEKALGSGVKVLDRMEQQESTFRMIGAEKWITFLMLAFILAIASFNVISTLSMLVIEKQDSIATLRAMGATRRMVSDVFRNEGWLISLAGGVAGIVVGVVLCLVQQFTGLIKLGGDHSMMVTDAYPVRVEALDLVWVLLLVAAIGWAASMVAAAMARRRGAQAGQSM